MPEYVYYYDADDYDAETYPPRLARLISRGAHASTIEYHASGMTWQVLVSNDDIEFIGDDQLDDED